MAASPRGAPAAGGTPGVRARAQADNRTFIRSARGKVMRLHMEVERRESDENEKEKAVQKEISKKASSLSAWDDLEDVANNNSTTRRHGKRGAIRQAQVADQQCNGSPKDAPEDDGESSSEEGDDGRRKPGSETAGGSSSSASEVAKQLRGGETPGGPSIAVAQRHDDAPPGVPTAAVVLSAQPALRKSRAVWWEESSTYQNKKDQRQQRRSSISVGSTDWAAVQRRKSDCDEILKRAKAKGRFGPALDDDDDEDLLSPMSPSEGNWDQLLEVPGSMASGPARRDNRFVLPDAGTESQGVSCLRSGARSMRTELIRRGSMHKQKALRTESFRETTVTFDEPHSSEAAVAPAPTEEERIISAPRSMQYSVVSCSDETPTGLAETVIADDGRWRAPACGHFCESLVVQVTHPTNLVGVEFGLDDDPELRPESCTVQYNVDSADGPWTDAWEFFVREASGEGRCSGRHHYGVGITNVSKHLLKHCGSAPVAWKLLDRNGDGRLTMEEFMEALNPLYVTAGADLAKAISQQGGIPALFAELDSKNQGYINLDDLIAASSSDGDDSRRKQTLPPPAKFWRLMFIKQGGGAAMSVLGQLQLLAPKADPKDQQQTVIPESVERLACAFQLNSLELHPETLMVRRMARESGLPTTLVEDARTAFKWADADGDATLTRDEFEALLLKLHGAKESTQVPRSRLDLFWQMATKDPKGQISFPVFLDAYAAFYWAANRMVEPSPFLRRDPHVNSALYRQNRKFSVIGTSHTTRANNAQRGGAHRNSRGSPSGSILAV